MFLALACVVSLTLGSGPLQGADDAFRYVAPPENQAFRSWLVLAPILIAPDAKEAPDTAAQRQAFARDFLAELGGEAAFVPRPGQRVRIDGKDLEWRLSKADSDVVAFGTEPDAPAHAVAYAWAEIEVPAARAAVVGLGSDDAVKVWLNGRLVHENWTARAIAQDADIVPVPFEKGVNRLLVKVQNVTGAWGLTCRLLGGAPLQSRFVRAAGAGETEQVEKLLGAGVPLDGRDARGLTALQAARLHGRKRAADLLVARGANATLPTPPVEEVVDRTLREIVKDGYPGVAVLVAKDGKLLFRRAYGSACLEHAVKATPETMYRIGSITQAVHGGGNP
jgi:hypothetical protein